MQSAASYFGQINDLLSCRFSPDPWSLRPLSGRNMSGGVAGWWWVQQKTSAVSKLKLAGPVSPELGAMARVTWRGEGLPRMAGAHLRDLKLAELRRAQRLRHSSCAHCAQASHPVCRVPNTGLRHRGISPLRLHRALSERLFGCWLSWVTYGVRYGGLTSAWAPIPCPLRGHTLSYARIGRSVPCVCMTADSLYA